MRVEFPLESTRITNSLRIWNIFLNKVFSQLSGDSSTSYWIIILRTQEQLSYFMSSNLFIIKSFQAVTHFCVLTFS